MTSVSTQQSLIIINASQFSLTEWTEKRDAVGTDLRGLRERSGWSFEFVNKRSGVNSCLTSGSWPGLGITETGRRGLGLDQNGQQAAAQHEAQSDNMSDALKGQVTPHPLLRSWTCAS